LRFVRYQGLKREQTLAQAMANCDDRMPLPALADALRAEWRKPRGEGRRGAAISSA